MLHYFFLIFALVQAAHAKEIEIALNWKAEPEFGGFYAALELGLYDQQGLKVKLIEGSSGTPTVQLLANGKVNYAIVSGDELLVSLDRNPEKPIIPIFTVYQKAPYMIMAHKDRKIKNLKELFYTEGIIAAQAGIPFFQFLLKKYPNPKAKIVPYPGGVSAFLLNKNYSQQGFIFSEPLLAQKKGANVQNFLIADEGFNPYTAVLAVSKEYFANNKDEVRSLVKAVRSGWENYLKDPFPTNKKMHILNPSMDLDIFNEGALKQVEFIRSLDTQKNSLGSMTVMRWKKLHKQLLELGIISNKDYKLELIQDI